MDMDSSGRARMRLPTADLPPDCAAPVTSKSPWSGGPGGRSLNVCDRPRSIRPCPVRSVQLSRRSPSRLSSNAGRAGSARRPRTGRARGGQRAGRFLHRHQRAGQRQVAPRRRGQHERRNLRALHVALYGTRASPKKGIASAATSKAVRMTPTDFSSTSICYSAPLPRDGGETMSKHIAAPSPPAARAAPTAPHHPQAPSALLDPGLPGSILSVKSSAFSSQRLNECSLRETRGGSLRARRRHNPRQVRVENHPRPLGMRPARRTGRAPQTAKYWPRRPTSPSSRRPEFRVDAQSVVVKGIHAA